MKGSSFSFEQVIIQWMCISPTLSNTGSFIKIHRSLFARMPQTPDSFLRYILRTF
jgi:hypothetical protein